MANQRSSEGSGSARQKEGEGRWSQEGRRRRKVRRKNKQEAEKGHARERRSNLNCASKKATWTARSANTSKKQGERHGRAASVEM